MNEEMIFTVVDENGNEMECEVVFYFHNDATDKDYLIYTDNKTDAAGNTQLYASIYQAGSCAPCFSGKGRGDRHICRCCRCSYRVYGCEKGKAERIGGPSVRCGSIKI